MSSGDSSPPEQGARDAFPAELAAAAMALAATVTGDDAATERAFAEALRRGLSPRALAEVAGMAHLFGGFPRAIQGLRALAQAARSAGLPLPLAPPSTAGDPAQLRDQGRLLFGRIYGPQADAVLAALADVVPDFQRWILEHAYGEVLSRPELAALQRELLAVAALTVLHCPAQLKSHVRGALRLGAPPAAVLQAVETVRSLCTRPEHHDTAQRLVDELLAGPDA